MSSCPDAPHPRALDALARLDDLRGLKHALESALDWLPIGFVLVDRESRVVQTNRAAQDRMRRDDGLTMRGEILDASDQEASLALREAIRRTSDGHPQSGATAAGIVKLPRRHERPLAVILVAVRPPPHSIDSPVLVALLIPEGDVRHQRSRHLLRDLYRLTEREADIAVDLLQGLSVNDIARHRELSVHTVRTHLKRVLEKTQTTRQPELLSVLMASFPPVERR